MREREKECKSLDRERLRERERTLSSIEGEREKRKNVFPLIQGEGNNFYEKRGVERKKEDVFPLKVKR